MGRLLYQHITADVTTQANDRQAHLGSSVLGVHVGKEFIEAELAFNVLFDQRNDANSIGGWVRGRGAYGCYVNRGDASLARHK